MIPIPEMSDPQVVFGCIGHLPKYEDVPDLSRLKPRDGVDRDMALRALQACLCSFEPKHEHKLAGAAMLLEEWFELESRHD